MHSLIIWYIYAVSLVNQVEDILLGKRDAAEIGIDRFKAINYKFSSNKLCQIDKARHIWSKMLNYTTGKQKDGNISYFILLDSVKKQIFSAVEEAKANIKLLWNNFNIFKAYMIEKVLSKEIKIRKRKIWDRRKIDILMYMITNEDFYKEISEKIS